MLSVSSTDIRVIRRGRTCPASLKFCLENKSVWLRYTPRNRRELYNTDIDTSIYTGEVNVK